jgi:hypothetical protein
MQNVKARLADHGPGGDLGCNRGDPAGGHIGEQQTGQAAKADQRQSADASPSMWVRQSRLA